MKKLAVLPVCLGCFFVVANSHAIDLKQSKVTQVVNDVQIISAASQSEKNAIVNDIFSMPDILRTGASSRAELVAPDETVTRVGANTIFSFDPENRSIDLKQGSLLFHSPHGKGGGTIHTGSATASVLGTTLIVVTTPNGGLKVIALEGEVQVSFANGLKQKLDPGQMTFVLPGANQLAPVIIFRLDELTHDSLLIKGFSHPLASLGLIQQQISKQDKLIASGKLGTTPYVVGNNASSTQVQVLVLDPNTVTSGQNQQPQQQPPPPSPPQNPPPPPQPPPPAPNLSLAEAGNAVINQPSLTDVSVPNNPVHLFLSPAFTVPNNNYFGPETFTGFVANNISVNTLDIPLNPLSVNVGYGGRTEFDIVAVGDFTIDGPVVFSGLASVENFQLIAGGAFDLAPGISIEADARTFTMSSPSAMDFNDVALVNNTKDIDLSSGDTITFENGASVTASGRIVADAANDISANDSQFNVGTAQFTSLNGGIYLEGSTVTSAGVANFTAPSIVSLDDSTISAGSVVINGTTAANITINNSTLGASDASGSILVSAESDIDVTGTQPAPSVRHANVTIINGSELNADPNNGSVTLSSQLGSVNISGTSIQAHYLTLSAGDCILLDASGQTVTAQGSGATANFTALNKVEVDNANFSSFAVLNMAANTIVLMNDTLAAISNFGCNSGQASFSRQIVQGDVNFICDKTSTGATVNSGNVQLTSGPVNSPGIHVY